MILSRFRAPLHAVCVLTGLLLVATTADAGPEKLDARLRARIEHNVPMRVSEGIPLQAPDRGNGGPEMVDVFVLGDVDEALLSGHGAQPGTVLDGLATARIPLPALEGLANSPRVTAIRAAQPMEPLLDKNRIETEVADMWGGNNPPTYPGFTGQGVIVGIVDTGIDLNHQDFKTASGSTRLLYLWDQNGGLQPPPSGFTYGQEWNASQLNAGALTYDNVGHGTHVAGGAAGNGRATGNGLAAYRYVGMAPEADIIVVKLNGGNDAQVLDAIAYIFGKATALRKDAVVCVAVGKQSGPHDGTDPLDVAVDALCGPGKIVVAAGGNEGKTKIHARRRLSVNQTLQASFSIPAYTLIGSPFVDLEGWFNQGQNVTLKLISPSGYTLGPLNMGQNGSMTNTDGWALVQWTVPASGPREIFLTISPPGAGEWRMEVKNVGTSMATVDFWIVRQQLSQGKVPTMLQGQSDSVCVASPASANEAVAVAAYTAKKSWVAQNGQSMSYSGATLNAIADFSSYGPRRDGVQKPEIAASGYGMAAARSANAVYSSTSIVDDGVHVMLTGTSIAASSASGAVALLLEQFPGLDAASLRTILSTRANTDANTGSVPNARWGSGKLSVADAPTSAVGDPPVTPEVRVDILKVGAPYPNPVRQLTRVPVSLETATDLVAAVYDVQGREVKLLHQGRMEAGDHFLVWEGRDNENAEVASGNYYLVVSSRGARQSRAVSLVK